MQVEIAPQYRPHPAQRRFHASGKRFVAACAGVRGGKTYGACVEFLNRIAKDLQQGKGRQVSGQGGKRRRPSLHYWLVAPTSALLREPWRYVFEIVPHQWIDRYYEAENALWLKGGILIEGKTADNPLHLVASGIDGLLADEAARIKADAWRGQLRQRLSDTQGWAIFASTPLGRNWLYEDIVTRSGIDPEYETVQWITADNPTIAREEIEAARTQLPKRYFEREYLASFNAFLGNVFDEFDEQSHLLTEQQLRLEYGHGNKPLRELFRRILCGVDWGWTSPGAMVIVGDTGRELIVLDESYAPNRLVIDLTQPAGTWLGEARRLKDLHGVSQFLADPSRPDAIFDMSRFGVSIAGAHNDILWGIRKMSEALHRENGRPRLRILAHCKNLIRELKSYVWDSVRGMDSFKEMPAPNQSDHALDACRYAVVELLRYATSGELSSGETSNRRGPGRPIG